MVDLLAERFARRDEAARVRAAALRAMLPALATRLYARGARRVIAFGSLVTGRKPHLETDIDLAVEGLTESELGEVALELMETTPAPIDLVRIEGASETLRARILREGEVVPRVTC